MKTIVLAAAAGSLLTTSVVASDDKLAVEDRLAIIDTITDIAAGADRHEWDRVLGAFAQTVTLDYTSLWGGTPTTQPAVEVVNQWSSFLPGFDETLHLVTNHAIREIGTDAVVAEADFQAIHAIGDDQWVLMGHYRYDLVRSSDGWKVTRMVMTKTHEQGDRGLTEIAAQRPSIRN